MYVHSKQRLSSFPSLIFNLIYNNFPTVVSFCSTTPLLARHNNFHLSRFLFLPMRTHFSLSSTLTLLLTHSKCPHDHSTFSHQFSHLSAFHLLSPTFSFSRQLSIFFTLSFFWLPHSSHTFASLVSRTLATRTVMSSMRSWILQLWPPLQAHEALLTLALGILSSMQPSSLAHTNACHYRPFPSDFGLKVYRPMHSIPSFIPFSHALTFLYMIHMVPLSTFLFSLGHLLISPMLLFRKFD